METKRYVQDYGSYKVFEIDNHGKVEVTFAWNAPDDIPKPVVFTFNKIVGQRIDEFVKEDQRRTDAIRQQLKAWDKELKSQQQVEELKLFVETVNRSLNDRFASISGGGATVGKALMKQVAADLQKDGHLEKAVKELLASAKTEIRVSITAKIVVKIAANALKGVAAGLGGEVVSLVLKVAGGAVTVGKSCYDFQKEWKALNDGAKLLCSLLQQQSKLMQESSKKYELVNHHLALLYTQLARHRTEAAHAEQDQKNLKAVLGRLDAASGRQLGAAQQDIDRIIEMTQRIHSAQIATDEARFKRLDSALEATRPLFDQKVVDSVLSELGACEGWGAALAKRADLAAELIQTSEHVCKVAEKVL